MIIYEDEELVIPAGIGPTINTASGSAILQKKTVEVTENGTSKIIPGVGYDGLSEVDLITKVPTQIKNQGKSVEYTENGNYTVVPDINFTGIDNVKIKVNLPTPPLQAITVDCSTNSQIFTPDASNYGLSRVTVNAIRGQFKTVSSTNQTQNVGPDSGFDALAEVIVAPIAGQEKTVIPSSSEQTITADLPYYALGTVTVQPAPVETAEIKSSATQQVVTPSDGKVGLSSVTVNPYILDDKTADSSTNTQIITSSEDGLNSVTINPYVLDSKTVDSSTVSQTITSDADGLASVTVNPYVLESKTVNPSFVDQTVTPSANYDGLSSVKVNKVTSDVDQNIAPNNIKLGVTILGVEGAYDPISGITTESKTVNSSTVAQKITATSADYLSEVNINPYVLDSKTVDASTNDQVVTSNYDGLSSVTVNKAKLRYKSLYLSDIVTNDASTASTTENIYPDSPYIGFNNIAIQKGFRANEVRFDASTNNVDYYPWTVYVNPPYNLSNFVASRSCFGHIRINKVTSAIDDNIQAGNIKSGVTILGVTGNFQGGNLTTATADSSSNAQTITPPEGYYGLSSVVINPYSAQSKTVDASVNSRTIHADQQYDALSSVTINPVTASIDSNITANKIKEGVTILGVTGTVVEAQYDIILSRLNAF